MTESYGRIKGKMMGILDYVKKHKVLQIGIDLPSHICSEVIVDEPEKFIRVIVQNGGYISAISWWERVAVGMKPQIGYGGPRDPKAPDEFFFAETDLESCFSVLTSEKEYLNYLALTLQTYPDITLFPAFEVQKKKT